MTANPVICSGCGAEFRPNRPDQHCCSAKCRAKAQRQRSKKRTLSAEIPFPTKNVRTAPAPLSMAFSGQKKIGDRSLKPCTRPGYPEDLVEGRDADGLPAFFGGDGDRLLRVWQGTSALSAVELRVMRLEPTGRGFAGGAFYREIAP